MDTQSLPIVSFGKYKDKSVLDLLADEKYVNWLKLQSWFPNQKQIYNIVVHQTIPSLNKNNSKTPEHNKLQNLFLEEDNQRNLLLQLYKNSFDIFNNKLKLLYKDKEFIKCFGINTIQELKPKLDKSSIKFEDKFNWDLILYYGDKQELEILSDLENELTEKLKYKETYDATQKNIFDNNLLLFDTLIKIRKKSNKEQMNEYKEKMDEYGEKYKQYEEDLKLYLKQFNQNHKDVDNYKQRLETYKNVRDRYKIKKEKEICNELKINSKKISYSIIAKDNTYNEQEKQQLINIINNKLQLFMKVFDEKYELPQNVKNIHILIPSVPLVPSAPNLKGDRNLSKEHKNYDITQKCLKLEEKTHYYNYNLPSVRNITNNINKYKEEYANNYDKKFDIHYKEYRKNYYESILKKYFSNCGYININQNQYSMQFTIINTNSAICCELKPTLSDEYPCVLRKLQTQIELTNNDNNKFQFKKKIYILIIGSFSSNSTSKEQLITIFKQSNINILFTDEIFDLSVVNTISCINTNSPVSDKKLATENKMLTDNLVQAQQKLLDAEETIKQLEEEILSLKTHIRQK